MSDLLIRLEPDSTGWHSNLAYPAPCLRDGWAVVSPGDQEALRRWGGVVIFDLLSADPGDYPQITDRRSRDRGGPYPVTANMRQGVYVPPAVPQPEPERPDVETRLTALETEKADRAQVEALWADMAGAYGEGVQEA